MIIDFFNDNIYLINLDNPLILLDLALGLLFFLALRPNTRNLHFNSRQPSRGSTSFDWGQKVSLDQSSTCRTYSAFLDRYSRLLGRSCYFRLCRKWLPFICTPLEDDWASEGDPLRLRLGFAYIGGPCWLLRWGRGYRCCWPDKKEPLIRRFCSIILRISIQVILLGNGSEKVGYGLAWSPWN